MIVGSYDRRLCWFDMDLSTKPYKTLRLVHQKRDFAKAEGRKTEEEGGRVAEAELGRSKIITRLRTVLRSKTRDKWLR